LSRPEVRNALSMDLLRALHSKIAPLASDENISVLVVTGAGKSFCAGMDLKLVLSDPALPLQLLSSLADFTIALRALPAITVAKVNGAAIGGGCGLACACDIAITHADSKMGFPEVDMGICPAVVAPVLATKIGLGRARQVLLSGGLLSGQQAFEKGLVDHVLPGASDLDRGTTELVARLVTGGPHAMRATKALLNQLDGSLDARMLRRGAEISAEVIAHPETQKALRARLGG
jgi:methylglutaconyl-CoA hydratase